MKFIYRWEKLRVASVAVLLALSAISQRAEAQATGGEGLFAYPSKESIHILVFPQALGDAAGFNVYRAPVADMNSKASDGDFELLTQSPVSPLKNTADISSAFGDSIVDQLSQLELNSADAFWPEYKKDPEKFEFISVLSAPVRRILGREFEDRNIESGGTYSYRVITMDDNGNTMMTYDVGPVQPVPPPLPTPQGFSLVAKDGGAEIKWQKPEPDKYAIGLNIYRGESQDGPFEKINGNVILGTSEPFFFDTALENSKVYFYYIASVDIVENAGAPSPVLSIEPKDMTPPAAPTNVKVELKDDSALLTWDMSLEPDVAGYQVFRSNEFEKGFAALNEELLDADVTSYTDESAEAGNPYYYRLTAVDKSDNFSTASVVVQLKMPDTVPPELPMGFNGKPAGKNTIRLSWDQNKDKDLLGYKVYRGMSAASMEPVHMDVLPKEQTEFEDNGVVSGEIYYYALVAVDEALNESTRTDPPLVIQAPDSIPPMYPTGLFALSEDSRVTVSWAPNQDSDLAGYKLYLSFEEEGEFKQIGGDLAKDRVEFVDEPVENGKKRWYYLVAVDSAGNEGEPSDKVAALPFDQVPPEAPSAPTGELAEKKIILSWNENPEKDIAGYIVMKTVASSSGIYEPISGDDPVPPGKLSFTDNKLETGVDYWYRIAALDTSGNSSRKSEPAGPFRIEEEKPAAGATAPEGNKKQQ